MKGRTSETKQLAEHIEFKPAQTLEEAIKFGQENLGIKSYNNFSENDLSAINWLNEGFVNVSNRMKGKLRMRNAINAYTKNPLEVIQSLFKDEKNISMFKEAGINTSLNDIKNLSLKEQIEIRKTMTALLREQNEASYVNNLIVSDKQYAEKLVEKGFLDKVETIKEIEPKKLTEIIKYTEEYTGKKENFYPIELYIDELDKSSPFATIYHEMGHLQDMKPRCLTTVKYNYDYSKYSQELKDWVDNDDNIRIASKVSGYSTSGPGEFIAETFAKLIEGRKVSKEVIDLYRKLGGPELPNM